MPIKKFNSIYNIFFFALTAFQCVLGGRPVVIPTEIPHTYVRKAEFIVSTSYDHSETFSSVSTIYANK